MKKLLYSERIFLMPSSSLSQAPTRLEEGRHCVDLEGERQGARGDGTGIRKIVPIGGMWFKTSV